MKECDEYIKRYCDEKGKQTDSNLTPAAERGRLKVAKLVRQKKIVCMPSDKGKGMVVVDRDIYERMGSDHTTADDVIDLKQARKCQAETNGHARALSRIFNVGQANGPRSQARCFDNATSHATHIPNMRAVAKTHKPPKEPNGHPQSRPIVAADSGITTNLSDLLSTIIEPVFKVNDSDEAQATEEMLNSIDKATERLVS